MDLAHLFLLTDLLDHEFQALSQFDIEAYVSERTYYRTVQIYCFEDESTTERFNPTMSGDELTTDQVNPLN
jgi:hypothetical protein